MTKARQTAIGLGLAAMIAGSWAVLHGYAVFFMSSRRGVSRSRRS
jgi:hypothetical protein